MDHVMEQLEELESETRDTLATLQHAHDATEM